MAVSPDFRDFVLDQLSGIMPAQRRMFGGVGLFVDGLMFGIITRTDTLYLKADDLLAAEFVALGAGPMSYTRDGKSRSMSYYAVPAEFLDDPDELSAWAQKAITAAHRVDAEKPKSAAATPKKAAKKRTPKKAS